MQKNNELYATILKTREDLKALIFLFYFKNNNNFFLLLQPSPTQSKDH